jgi:outer membrane receptor protein involved in Fe transport
MKSFLFFVAFLGLSSTGFCQTNNSSLLLGTVLDSLGNGIDNVNVLLLNLKESAPGRAAITNTAGNFVINGINKGNYSLTVTKEGFKKQFIVLLIIEDTVHFRVFTLSDSIKTLRGITVHAKRQLIEYTDDKVVYNVGTDPLAAAGTALDLLRKTPMVTVDQQGNIQVNGQANFRVLLNGRETSMFARNVSEVLNGFPGKLVNRIEVNINPSAKYDAEGVGGIIDIITKKPIEGYNFTVSGGLATAGDVLTVSSSLNLKYGKLGISSNMIRSRSYSPANKIFEEILSVNPIALTKRISNSSSETRSYWQSGNMEVSLELDSLNILSTYIGPGGGRKRSQEASLQNLIVPARSDTLKSLYNAYSDNDFPSFNTGLDYVRKFADNKEKELSIRLNVDFGKDDTYATSEQKNQFGDRFIINDNKVVNRQYTFQFDFIQPVSKGRKIELGAKAIIRRANSNYQSLVKYNALDMYQLNQLNTDQFLYNQNVFSAYTAYNFMLRKFTFQAGLRAEITDLYCDFRNSALMVSQKYTNLLPNLLVSTKFTNGQIFSFTYSMRLARPYIWHLNPFLNNTDSLLVNQGNPRLKPQKFHALSVQYRFTTGNTFVSVSLSNNFSNDRIVQFSIFDDITGVTTSSLANIGRNSQTSLSINVNGKLNSKWTVNANGRVAYDLIENRTGGSTQKNNGFSGNGFVTSGFNFTSKFAASANFGFSRNAPSIQAT